MSAIIPSPARSIAFKILPIPKYLKIAKTVTQADIINPRFEFAKINEKMKNKNVNKFAKKRKINNEDLGSVK